jgi:DNA-binding XRE family transcriptional regulator
LHTKALKDLAKAVEVGVKTKLRRIEKDAAKASLEIAKKWSEKGVHWCTFRAVVTRSGEYQSRLRQEPISWNDDL